MEKPELWGYYTEEQIAMLKREMVDPFNFKEYVTNSRIKDTPKMICVLNAKH